MPNLWQVGGVVVNSKVYSAFAQGDIFWIGISSGWTDIALHELGHAAFKLGDEYESWMGCKSSETSQNYAPTDEPDWWSNVTTKTDKRILKWRHLLTPGVEVPTMINKNCNECDPRP
ncbi:M64 family metallopeptidase [Pseudobacteroides cellulosolvens]|nr:M64 family metallopeptidase [Pseudobacteroides cellulosolvens]